MLAGGAGTWEGMHAAKKGCMQPELHPVARCSLTIKLGAGVDLCVHSIPFCAVS
jgi:hypothetical protein